MDVGRDWAGVDCHEECFYNTRIQGEQETSLEEEGLFVAGCCTDQDARKGVF